MTLQTATVSSPTGVRSRGACSRRAGDGDAAPSPCTRTRRRRAVRARGRRAGAAAAAPPTAYLTDRRADRRRAGSRRRRDPPGLRIPLRERRVRARVHGRGADLGRPAAGGDRRDGLQDRRQADARRRRGARCSTSSTPPGHRVGLPVLVKASAGGGGRGMRVVTELSALAAGSPRRGARPRRRSATTRCSRAVLSTGRHVEIQMLADAHGEVWALGERECSIQRRHQKMLEEAPSLAVDDSLHARQTVRRRTTRRRAIGYIGAGTVEFLPSPPDGSFYFLEMNTRLQVEHPVTECVTGLDLVALQLEIADGGRLGRRTAGGSAATRSRHGCTPRTRRRLAAAGRHAVAFESRRACRVRTR